MKIEHHAKGEQFRLACNNGHRALRQKIDSDGWICGTCCDEPVYVVDLATDTVVWRSEFPDPATFDVPTQRQIGAMIEASPRSTGELADTMGVSPSTVRGWKRGEHTPSVECLSELLDELEASIHG